MIRSFVYATIIALPWSPVVAQDEGSKLMTIYYFMSQFRPAEFERGAVPVIQSDPANASVLKECLEKFIASNPVIPPILTGPVVPGGQQPISDGGTATTWARDFMRFLEGAEWCATTTGQMAYLLEMQRQFACQFTDGQCEMLEQELVQSIAPQVEASFAVCTD